MKNLSNRVEESRSQRTIIKWQWKSRNQDLEGGKTLNFRSTDFEERLELKRFVEGSRQPIITERNDFLSKNFPEFETKLFKWIIEKVFGQRFVN